MIGASSDCPAALSPRYAFLGHGVVVHLVAENLIAAPVLSITRTEEVGPLVKNIRFLRLCSTNLSHTIRLFLKRT